jgi:hypothetical protein
VEGNAGSKVCRLPVRLSRRVGQDVTVTWRTEPGTATPGDYVSMTRSMRITGWGGTIPVTVRGDVDVEPSETLRVRLTSARGAAIAEPPGTAIVTNDD